MKKIIKLLFILNLIINIAHSQDDQKEKKEESTPKKEKIDWSSAKLYNVRVSPLGLLLGQISGTLDFKLRSDLTIGPSLSLFSLTVGDTSISSFAGLSSDSPDWLITINSFLGRGQPLYLAIYISLIVFFAFFYTAIVFNPKDTADNLKKYGGFIPGIRPGENTANYLDFVLTRLTVIGSLYLSFICLLPELLISKYKVPFYFGGTSLLIVVSVTMDTVNQIQSYLLAHQYEGLIRKSNLRRR